MRKNLKKLKFNVLFYFLIFTTIIIGCLWVFQIFFIENYYQKIKFEQIQNFGQNFSTLDYGSEEFKSEVFACKDASVNVYYATKTNYAVASYDFVVKDGEGKVIDPNSAEYGIIQKAIIRYVQNAESYASGVNSDGNSINDVFYYCSSAKEDGTYLILTSPKEKLKEVISVIRIQFLLVLSIVLLVAVFLAWYFSIKLSKPIDEMSETAKKWADGDLTVSFSPKQTYSEINELADALNYAKEEISKSGALQRDLLANVSHDLKTPLTMIKAYAEMIRDISGENKEKRARHSQVIIDEADRLTALVNDILNLSKLQSAVDELEKTEINLSELTERVVRRFSDYVERQGYSIEEHIAPDLLTFADEKKIEQVIYNLLGNSINYTGEDKTVKIFLTAENDSILLEIIDSGKGISKEKMDTIWERYYRFSETNTRPVKGTGLGLSIVKAILDSHKLQYGVKSKKDCGSNFFVRFERLKNSE